MLFRGSESLVCLDAAVEELSQKKHRPAPEFGQVWKRRSGALYVLIEAARNGMCYRVYSDGGINERRSLRRSVGAMDTYVGQFAGFKVEGE